MTVDFLLHSQRCYAFSGSGMWLILRPKYWTWRSGLGSKRIIFLINSFAVSMVFKLPISISYVLINTQNQFLHITQD